MRKERQEYLPKINTLLFRSFNCCTTLPFYVANAIETILQVILLWPMTEWQLNSISDPTKTNQIEKCKRTEYYFIPSTLCRSRLNYFSTNLATNTIYISHRRVEYLRMSTSRKSLMRCKLTPRGGRGHRKTQLLYLGSVVCHPVHHSPIDMYATQYG